MKVDDVGAGLMRFFIIASLAFLWPFQTEAMYVVPPGVECGDPDAQNIDFNCNFVFDEQAQSALDATYKELLGRLNAEEANALKASQRAWLKFRRAEVALVIKHYDEGGSLGQSIGARRSFELTRLRLQDLRRRLDDNGKW